MIRFYWRPLFPGEQDAELLWGSILGAGMLLAGFWIWSGLPTPLCLFHTMTGLPCPTCGMTRSLRCLVMGDPVSAFLFNPLGLICMIGLALYFLYAVTVITARLPRLRVELHSEKLRRFLLIVGFLLIVLNWLYLLLHEKFVTAL